MSDDTPITLFGPPADPDNPKRPEIEGCACGEDHWEMPVDEVYEGSGLVEMVCRAHKKHIPCRPCLAEEGGERRRHLFG